MIGWCDLNRSHFIFRAIGRPIAQVRGYHIGASHGVMNVV